MHKHILFVNDESIGVGVRDSDLFGAAVSLARAGDGFITGLCVVPRYVQFSIAGARHGSEAQAAHVRRAAATALEITRALDEMRIKGVGLVAEVQPFNEDVPSTILRFAAQCGADLIIMSASNRASGRFVGSLPLANKVLRRCEIPLLLIPASQLLPS